MMDDANIMLDPDPARASPWHFVFTTKDAAGDQYEEQFAIVTGAAPRLASLDHYAQRSVLASAERYWPSDRQHMWKAVPRAGAFSFRNAASRRLLCQSRTAGVADTAPPSACDNPACLWRLVDPHTRAPCAVLYDATASVVPPEVSGVSEAEETKTQAVPPRLLLRTQEASSDVAERFAQSIKLEQDLVRGMVDGGYTAIVLGPQLVMGFKDGLITKTYLQDEGGMFGMPKFKAKDGFEASPT
ncbi:hypothetical protein PsYK624_164510 [Phanerochaete sordida]|uniref:Uncharacterized protein n=1 Tax=Phanerochaete sordida TaxID=48140 RepID=A0A9P3GSQ3_9APHY|nr:hypothetical protein PsYK624_164510 [Phanerochaete sordida]